ncbi:MAG: hypothetical protein ACYCX4_07280, partial [Bacillota bacterium]
KRGWYNMCIKDGHTNEGDIKMAIAQEPTKKSNSQDVTDHKVKVTKAIKEITHQHDKLLKKLAE